MGHSLGNTDLAQPCYFVGWGAGKAANISQAPTVRDTPYALAIPALQGRSVCAHCTDDETDQE